MDRGKKRSRLKEAAKDVAEGNLTLEDLTKAIREACTERNLCLGAQGAFYNPPGEQTSYQFNMEAFQRSAAAIARNRERTAALMRAATKPLPTANINNNILNSSEEGPDLPTPIVEPSRSALCPTFQP